MGITERETDMILTNISELKNDMRISHKEINQRLSSIGELLQVHNGRMDDFELKQAEIRIWIQNEEKQQKKREHDTEMREKRFSWLLPTIATITAIIVSVVVKYLG